MLEPLNTRAFVINLDEHPDRWEETLAELKRIEQVVGPVERVSAVKASPGWQGCRLSHIKVLRKALDECGDEIKYLAVFEDDFMWCKWCADPAAALQQAITGVKFDVTSLNYTPRPGWRRITQAAPHLLRLFDTYSTAGYIVHRRFWQTLHDFWLANDKEHIDKSWQRLQNKHVFLGVAPCFSNQREHLSTITNVLDPGEVQVLLLLPPGLDNISKLARAMFCSQEIQEADECTAAAKEAVTSGDYDVAIVVEKPAVFSELVGCINDILDITLKAGNKKMPPEGFRVFRRRGTLDKKFWTRK